MLIELISDELVFPLSDLCTYSLTRGHFVGDARLFFLKILSNVAKKLREVLFFEIASENWQNFLALRAKT